ncbi:MAG TPA: 50S ribosomal protein L32 [Candidatus Magasanikbacteria bacterium]|nr:50S ribosomal protein L32 [Candidatus Magasanikbacteria bacterium]
MGLPSKKRTPRSKHDRASHFALKKTTTTKCSTCNAVIKPHVACAKCGNYRGKSVVNVEKRTARLKRSQKATGKTSK